MAPDELFRFIPSGRYAGLLVGNNVFRFSDRFAQAMSCAILIMESTPNCRRLFAVRIRGFPNITLPDH